MWNVARFSAFQGGEPSGTRPGVDEGWAVPHPQRRSGTGLLLEAATDNVVRGNVITDSRNAGIHLAGTPAPEGNVIDNNAFHNETNVDYEADPAPDQWSRMPESGVRFMRLRVVG